MADYVGGFDRLLIGMANENQRAREKSAELYAKNKTGSRYVNNSQGIFDTKTKKYIKQDKSKSSKQNVQKVKNDNGTTDFYEIIKKDGKTYKQKLNNYVPPSEFGDIKIDTPIAKKQVNIQKPKAKFNVDTKAGRIAKKRAENLAQYKIDKEEQKNQQSFTQKYFGFSY